LQRLRPCGASKKSACENLLAPWKEKANGPLQAAGRRVEEAQRTSSSWRRLWNGDPIPWAETDSSSGAPPRVTHSPRAERRGVETWEPAYLVCWTSRASEREEK
jgi:hypothetical protein